MSLDMRERVDVLARGWRRRGHVLGYSMARPTGLEPVFPP
jgi:hypothetical protein